MVGWLGCVLNVAKNKWRRLAVFGMVTCSLLT